MNIDPNSKNSTDTRSAQAIEVDASQHPHQQLQSQPAPQQGLATATNMPSKPSPIGTVESTYTLQEVPSEQELPANKYYLMMSALVASGFLLVAIGSLFFSDPSFSHLFPHFESLTAIIASLAAVLVGCFIQYRGAKSNSVALCLVGFYVISAVLGAFTAVLLQYYELQSITAAFFGTIVIAVVFGALGFAFPSFFEKIHGLLIVALIALIIAEVVLLLLGVGQEWTNWLVLAVFCGFIGYDFYKATQVPKTKIHAVMYATSIYLDLLNVFIRLLAIFGKRR